MCKEDDERAGRGPDASGMSEAARVYKPSEEDSQEGAEAANTTRSVPVGRPLAPEVYDSLKEMARTRKPLSGGDDAQEDRSEEG